MLPQNEASGAWTHCALLWQNSGKKWKKGGKSIDTKYFLW